jgi:F-type H+-transporting ATPase subunit gamma
VEHKYLTAGASSKKAVVVITSNRGLAGGYNSNVVKLVTRNPEWKKEDLVIYTLGNKGREALARNGYEVKECNPEIIESPTYADAMQLSAELLNAYAAGEVGEIYLAYTNFKNTVSHVPTLLKLLPVEVEEKEKEQTQTAEAIMNFEPEDVEALDLLIPKYVTSQIYGGLMEAVASENGARMQAMDSATSNAEDMISDLALKYNRARQGSITQELTEIIAGAEALG